MVLGCGKGNATNDRLHVEAAITPQPARVGAVRLVLKLSDDLGKPIENSQVTLESNMSHAGMKPVFANATEVSPGTYNCNTSFTMGGDWVMTVHVVRASGEKLERQFEIRGVRSD